MVIAELVITYTSIIAHLVIKIIVYLDHLCTQRTASLEFLSEGYLFDLHWVMLQYTYLLNTTAIPYVESHNWVNVKNLTSCSFMVHLVNDTH